MDWREQDFDKHQVSEIGRIGGALLLVGIGIWIGARLFAGDAPLINDTG